MRRGCGAAVFVALVFAVLALAAGCADAALKSPGSVSKEVDVLLRDDTAEPVAIPNRYAVITLTRVSFGGLSLRLALTQPIVADRQTLTHRGGELTPTINHRPRLQACPSWLAEYGAMYDFLAKSVRVYLDRVRVKSVDGTMSPRIEVFEYDEKRSLEPGALDARSVKRSELRPGTKVEDIRRFLADHGILPLRRGRARFARNERNIQEAEARAAAELAAATAAADGVARSEL